MRRTFGSSVLAMVADSGVASAQGFGNLPSDAYAGFPSYSANQSIGTVDPSTVTTPFEGDALTDGYSFRLGYMDPVNNFEIGLELAAKAGDFLGRTYTSTGSRSYKGSTRSTTYGLRVALPARFGAPPL